MISKVFTYIIAPALLALTLGGCDNGGNENETNTTELPQTLPEQFTDLQGNLWTCPKLDSEAVLSGEFELNREVSISRADIIHIALVELNRDTDELRQLAFKCINNILSYNLDFSFAYPAQEVSEAEQYQYLLSTRFFKKADTGEYQLFMGPDGLLEVISNERTEDLIILLDPF